MSWSWLGSDDVDDNEEGNEFGNAMVVSVFIPSYQYIGRAYPVLIGK